MGGEATFICNHGQLPHSKFLYVKYVKAIDAYTWLYDYYSGLTHKVLIQIAADDILIFFFKLLFK